jgi:predicted Fe-S protein YdhL (DUF1289 family)
LAELPIGSLLPATSFQPHRQGPCINASRHPNKISRNMKEDLQEPYVQTPCVRICKIEDDVCIGCNRTLDEIRVWMGASSEEKLAILAEVARRDEHRAVNNVNV